MKPEIRLRLGVLSAFYLLLMATVWGVALMIGDNVRPAHFMTHFLGFGAAIIGFLAIVYSFSPKHLRSFNGLKVGDQAWVLVTVPITLVTVYFILLGNVPFIDAIIANEYYAVSRIRTDISKSGFPESYIPSLVTRSLGPAIVIYFLHMKKLKEAFFVFLSAAAIGLLTITKGHVVFATVPVVLYCVLTKRFLQAGLFLSVSVVMIYTVMVVTNPVANTACGFSNDPSNPACQVTAEPLTQEDGILDPLPDEDSVAEPSPTSGENIKSPRTVEKLAKSLGRRTLLVPGQVVAEWFEIFPAKVPFEYGCGYRFLAPLVGCDFQQNARLVYEIQYPDRAAQGILGNRNAAHFMEEYANFGVPGLFLAGALASAAICVATLLMINISLPAFLSLNAVFLLMLASTALHTTLLSGGWFMAMITSAVLLTRSNLKATDATAQDAI